MTPRTLFTWLARAEAVTWTLLLIGMWLKYLTRATDLGVRVFGLAHGVVFLAFLLAVVLLWVDQRWRPADAAVALVAAVVPFATLWVERRVERRSLAADHWRLAPTGEHPSTLPERVVATALARPGVALVVAVVAVSLTTAALLVVGPPPVPGSGA